MKLEKKLHKKNYSVKVLFSYNTLQLQPKDERYDSKNANQLQTAMEGTQHY